MSGSLLEANLYALRSRWPALAELLAATAPADDVAVQVAQNGQLVPVVRPQGSPGRPWPLHSLYDPRKEAERLAAAVSGTGFAVVLGLGAGYHVRALLQDSRMGRLLAVESDPAHVRSLLEHVPLHDVLDDPRLELLVAVSPSELERHVLAAYQPLLHGRFTLLPLQPRVRTAPSYFSAAAEAARRGLQAASADYSVQARFGRLWFLNILGNLAALARSRPPASLTGKAVVAAAGPSLETSLPAAASAFRAGLPLLATDTALPLLCARGIVPSLVLSIDCQLWGYRHFMAGLPAGAALALDLASPPLLARLASAVHFLASPHPLVQLVDRTLAPLPPLDTSGGNVTHAAVALAFHLGAEQVEVIGADFAYPAGKPYARGTYFYPHFLSTATRTSPADGSLFRFVLEQADAGALPRGGILDYRSHKLDAYRERLAQGFGPLEEVAPGHFVCRRPRGLYPPRSTQTRAGSPADWRGWLEEYHRGLSRLEPLREPVHRAWQSLCEPHRVLWSTVLPAAAAMPGDSASARLETARTWCCRRIRERLQATGATSPRS